MARESGFTRFQRGQSVYLVGIKGQGMTALAEILLARGIRVSGSDTHERFYTDGILQELGIPYFEGFSAEHVGPDLDCVIRSVAYDPERNAELREARAVDLPVLTYPEALGILSRQSDFSGICGVHGKTTTTAMAGVLLKAFSIPATVLVGSGVAGFGGRSTLTAGERYMVAETDEYRRNFLHYSPDRIVLTSIEPDHLDYYGDLDDMIRAFSSYLRSLSKGGTLIYNADDPVVDRLARRVGEDRPDLRLKVYGRAAAGPYRIGDVEMGPGRTRFRLEGFDRALMLRIPGAHSAWNAAAAAALVLDILGESGGRAEAKRRERVVAAVLEGFRGTRRRCEVLGSAGGVMFMDDYAHHPTAIRKTLEGIRAFYPDRRIVVDFMSHTYSRTRALMDDFAACFAGADKVILHRIYASARESDDGGVTDRDLFRRVAGEHPDVLYFHEPEDARSAVGALLRPGDLFLTMGAGSNWQLGRALFEELSKRGGGSN